MRFHKVLHQKGFIALFFLLVIAFVIRLKDIMLFDEWFDCSYTRLMTEKSFKFLIFNPVDVHPTPNIFYLLQKFWSELFGYTIYTQRLLIAILGIIFLISIFYITKRLKSPKIAFIATFLATFSLSYIKYSQENRMYMLLSIFIIWAFYHYHSKNYILLSIFLTLSIYTHYYASFFLIFILLDVILTKTLSKKLIKSLVTAFILLIPLVFHFFIQIHRIEGMWLKSPKITSILSTYSYFMIIPSNTPMNDALSGGILIIPIAIFISTFIFYKYSKLNMRLGIICLLVPLIVFISALMIKIPFHHRFLLMFGFGFYILLATGIERLSSCFWRNKTILFIILLLWAIFQSAYYHHYYSNPQNELQMMNNALICPAKVLHESPFSALPSMIYKPDCEHYVLTNLTEAQQRSAGFDVIERKHINSYNTTYDYYFKSLHKYMEGTAILELDGISLIKNEKN